MKARKFRIVTAASAIAVGLVASLTAQAAPSGVGSPLVGPFCSSGTSITGQGASFAANAHNQAFIPAYQDASVCGKGTVSYTGNGSGAGKSAAMNHVGDFSGTDEPLSIDEQAIATGDLNARQGRVSPIHHIPIALGAVSVPANLGACGIGQEELNLRSQQISQIFMGLVKKWNDPLLTVGNPKLANCTLDVKIAVRSDGSGTTYAFKDFLSKRNPQWNVYKQNQFNTAWPGETLGNPPLRGKGNPGVASVVATTPGAIGYVDLSTAMGAGLSWAKVDGPHLQFVSPRAGATAANCDFAALGAPHPASTLSPGWDAVSITDSPNPLAYPICTFTYALVFNNLRLAYGSGYSKDRAQTLVDYFAVAVDDIAQSRLPGIGYGRLPVNVQQVAKAGLASIVL